MSTNNWINHTKDYARKHGLTYKQALKAAGPSYHQRQVGGGSDDADEYENKTPFKVGQIVYEPSRNTLGKIVRIRFKAITYNIIGGPQNGKTFNSGEEYGLRLATMEDVVASQQ